MATYLELFALRSDSSLQDRIAVAVVIKAQGLLDGAAPSTNEVAWASAAIQSPQAKAKALLNYVLGANSSASVSVIQGASDSVIQGNINTAVDALIAGGAA